MNINKQIITRLIPVILFMVLGLQGIAQSKSIKPEPEDRWDAPFVRVKKMHPIFFGFVLISKNGIQ